MLCNIVKLWYRMLLTEKDKTIKMLLWVPDRKYKKRQLGNKS